MYQAVTAATSAPNASDCGSSAIMTGRRSVVVSEPPVDPVPVPALAEGLAADAGEALAEGLAADEAAVEAEVSVDSGEPLGVSVDVARADAAPDGDPDATGPDGEAVGASPEIVPDV